MSHRFTCWTFHPANLDSSTVAPIRVMSSISSPEAHLGSYISTDRGLPRPPCSNRGFSYIQGQRPPTAFTQSAKFPLNLKILISKPLHDQTSAPKDMSPMTTTQPV